MNKIKPQIGPVKKNEVLLKDNAEWLHFCDPYRLIVAENLSEVLPGLRQIEQLTQTHGWHAAGFLSYEAASAFDPALRTHASSSLPETHPSLRSARTTGLPYLWFGLYPESRPFRLPDPTLPNEILDWCPVVKREIYNSAITRIKELIAEGRTYQVNYTMRLQTEFKDSAWNFFLHLIRDQNNHAAYIDMGRYVVCSASPELFFQLDDRTITCRPMKGTTPRGRTTTEDREQAEWLRNSEKNRAENVMIVDMIRNDLGRIAEIGSVQATQLFELERYPTLWQMTSTVSARTDAGIADIFAALFPCASITGAPKVSTMGIIADLESGPRKIYTGAIGYLAPRRRGKFNVAIRTALVDREDHKAEYGVGGGIVWDSTSADEYMEALLKARVLVQQRPSFSLLETILWTPDGGFFLREKHTARMLDSAAYFDIPSPNGNIEEFLDQISHNFEVPQRVRVLMDQHGKLNYESDSLDSAENAQPLRAALAREPVDSGNIFLFHKTTLRDIYESARKGFEELDDVLLYNEQQELTEFTIGNLVVELEGKLFTPPISCGVLAGTFRAHLLETDQVRERTIFVRNLVHCTKIFRVNSVRRWQQIELQL